MNRIKLLSLLTVLFVTSCQDIYKEIFNPEGKVVPMSFYAGIETSADSVKTKTVLDGNPSDQFRSVLWEYQDEVYVTNGYSSSKFINTTQGTSTVAMLEGELSQASAYYAAYPYDMVEEYSSSSMTVTLPGKQTYFKYGIQPESFPMVAKCGEGVFDFRNLCGIFVLQLLGDKSVSSISFSGKDETGKNIPISGTGTVSMDYSDYPVLEMATNASTTLELVCPDVELNTVSPTFFHIILPPGTYSSFKIVVSFTDGTSMCLKSDKALNIKRSVRTTAAVLEYNDPIDLSEDGSANCYIVSTAGKYRFDAVKGNSGESVGAVENAEVLWESFGTDVVPSIGDLVRNVNYKDGYIEFDTPSVHKEGNAVIAAKNASGTILWSWHIWLTDQPEEQVYYNNAGTMMDRNLGATSATPGDVGALGLLYQWGRKDPFLGSSCIGEAVEAMSTANWPLFERSTAVVGSTIEYSIENPMCFIGVEARDSDWYYTDSSATDKTRWSVDKTIYDPCPVGWCVPEGGDHGIWSKGCGSSSNFNDGSLYNSINDGMNFSGKLGGASIIWYPTTARRDDWSGKLYYPYGAIYWSTNTNIFCFYDVSVSPSARGSAGYAQPVRCSKIEKRNNQSPIVSNAIDLSLGTNTANCYIISKAGDYKFKAVIGNSNEFVESINKAEVIWESFGTSFKPDVGDLIKNVSYSEGYIYFSTPTTFNEGNALIAAKDETGEILWSWHIWLTDQPEEQVYHNDAGTMMDRNLGATSATPGDVGALGLLYQWGRKDPFLGSSEIHSSKEPESTGSWMTVEMYRTMDSTRETIDYAIKHPTTFITCDDYNRGYDWCYDGNSSANQKRWQSDKTIYDPCPAGWRVPDGYSDGIWSNVCGSLSAFYDYTFDSVNGGINFTIQFGDDPSIWYPASGYRSNVDGLLNQVGVRGAYSSSIPRSVFGTTGLIFNEKGCVSPSGHDPSLKYRERAEGLSVRCFKENSDFTSDTDVPNTSSIDLSVDGQTSNCYIITSPGVYKFQTVKGNSNESVGIISDVEVLWESYGSHIIPFVGSLVKNVTFSDGYISFSTPSTFKEGNAVIAAKDASGTILWSWHIWVTDMPDEHIYPNNAGTMMDRNLGATSATPGDVGALGLFYQWGRKDPFLGSSSISKGVKALSTISWPSVVEGPVTIDYAIQNPTSYIDNAAYYSNWCSTVRIDLWDTSKTIYDPCPVGWVVPKGNNSSIWENAKIEDIIFDSTNFGLNIDLGNSVFVWYPAAGYMWPSNGTLNNVKYGCYCWTSSRDDFYADSVHLSSTKCSFDERTGHSSGLSIRCQKE